MRFASLGLLACLALPAVTTAGGPPALVHKSLVICLDGMRADGLEEADAPRIHALVAGRWQPGYRCASSYTAQTIKDATTGSGPNHTTIFTGVTSAAHHVRGNVDKQMAAVAYPDYFARLKASNPKLSTARLACWKPDVLVPSGADYVDVAGDAVTAARATHMIDGTFADARWQRGRDVDALLAFINNPDEVGHATGFGPSNPKYLAALHVLDGYVGAMLDAVAARPTFDREDWQVIITTDHGGYHTNHGGMEAECYNVPFIVASRDVQQGTLAGMPTLADVAPTVLRHMGVSTDQAFTTTAGVEYRLPGHAQGDAVLAPALHRLTDGLLVHLPFEDGIANVIGGPARPTTTGTPRFVDGKFGRAISITPDTGHVTVASAGALPIGHGGCTVAFWYRAPANQTGDPVILGNKDWASRDNPGMLLTASVAKGKSDLGLNLASAATGRCDVYRIDVSPNAWWFIAATVRPDGPAVLYAGSPDGRLQFIANDATHLGDHAGPLPLNLGQDGTGKYPAALTADIDDLAIWDRPLSLDEIHTLYNHGSGTTLPGR